MSDSPPPSETSRGGVNPGRLLLGLVMMIAGGYLFLDNIQLTQSFSWDYSLFSVGGLRMTTGMVLVPFIFGIGMIFYNPDNDIGWFLALATLVLLLFGIVTSLQLRLRPMSAFELGVILTLLVGGLGLFLSALRGALRSR